RVLVVEAKAIQLACAQLWHPAREVTRAVALEAVARASALAVNVSLHHVEAAAVRCPDPEVGASRAVRLGAHRKASTLVSQLNAFSESRWMPHVLIGRASRGSRSTWLSCPSWPAREPLPNARPHAGARRAPGRRWRAWMARAARGW